MIRYSNVILQPTSEPVTVAEAKARLRVTSDDEDAIITALIKVARRLCESYSGLSFMPQTRVMKLDSFPAYPTYFELAYGPIIAISGNDAAAPTPNALGISYTDGDGVTQTLTLTTDFRLDSHSAIPRLSPVDSWPSSVDDIENAVTVTYTAGYADANSVPPEAKQAILFQVAYMYENPEGGEHGLCYAAQDLLDCIKVYWNAG